MTYRVLELRGFGVWGFGALVLELRGFGVWGFGALGLGV